MNMFQAFMELDKLHESYSDRAALIDNLKSIGRRYDFDKYSTPQLFYIWQKESAKGSKQSRKMSASVPEVRTRPQCDECGLTLTDGGYCPSCDDGAEDLFESTTGTKHEYMCDDCGFYGEFYDEAVADGCCPNCLNHHGNFNRCEEGPGDPLAHEQLAYLKEKPRYAWTDEDWELYVSLSDDPTIYRSTHGLPEILDESNWIARTVAPAQQQPTAASKPASKPGRKYMANAKYVLAIEPPADQDDPVFWYFDSDSDEYDRDDLATALAENPYCATSSFDEIVCDARALVGSYSEDEVYIVVYDDATLNILDCIELDDCQEYKDYNKEYNKRLGLSEGVFDDITAPDRNRWVSRTPVQQKQPQPSVQSAPVAPTTPPTPPAPAVPSNKIVTIFYDYSAHKLRAMADDGIHGVANVAFPTKLRNKVGQKYIVDDLVWNGKNYRAVGNIVPL